MKIGWIGTGVMGAAMAGHLQNAGHELFVFNRSREKTEDLTEKGARRAPSPAEVAAALNLSLPGLALVHQLYLAVKAHGHGRSVTQALILALKGVNGR